MRWCILLLSAGNLMAQSATATLFGIVRDSSGGVLPQVEISVIHVATSYSRKVRTDEKGEYLITNLPIGQYSITAEKTGFRRFIQDGVNLEVNQNARVDAVLSLGQITESISVTADATGVDTRSSSVGEVVDRLRVQELPLNGRNAMELARIVPGVARSSA